MSQLDNREELFSDTVKQIHAALKNATAYPENHPVADEVIRKSYETLIGLLNKQPLFTACVVGNKLMVDDLLIDSGGAFSSGFAKTLSQRDVDSITFYRGLSHKEFVIFLQSLMQRPKLLRKKGGLASLLSQNGVSKIKINNVKYGQITEGLGLGDSAAFDVNPEPQIFEEKSPSVSEVALGDSGLEERHEETPTQRLDILAHDESARVKNQLVAMLSDGRTEKVGSLLKDMCEKLDDASGAIRKRFLENFKEITSTLEEFDKLKEHFREISTALIKRVEQDNYVDNYLLSSDNLYKICSSQNRITTFLRDETVGNRLFKAHQISKSQLQEALTARWKNGRSLQYNLAEKCLVEEAVLTKALADQYNGCRTVTFSNMDVIPDFVLRTIPKKYISRYLVLPFKLDAGALLTATMKPTDRNTMDDLRFITGYSVVPHLATEYHMLQAILNYYNISGDYRNIYRKNEIEEFQDENIEFVEREEPEEAAQEELRDSDAPVIRLVNQVLREAVSRKASDIHIEPYENEMRIRLRIDGTLTTILRPPVTYRSVVPSRIKVMAKLDISEKRLSQDGRFKVRLDGQFLDFRVSVFPGLYGEKVVLRLLNSASLSLGVNNMGLNRIQDLNTFLTAMHKSKGMILVTGPTGSGKTTSLYCMLHDLNDGSKNISTVEDPIEYNLRGINQFQVHSEIGLDFPRALRTLLRQDPDIIMVGEIRDNETAEIAMRAALTGHLVLSTLHTNSAAEAITRLLDMGLEPYLINSCVSLFVAQRLLRTICTRCKTETTATDLQREILKGCGVSENLRLFSGEGCNECNGTGYKGRVPIYELMPMCNEIRALISKSTPSFEIENKAKELGLITLESEAFKKVQEGITSLDECVRVVF